MPIPLPDPDPYPPGLPLDSFDRPDFSNGALKISLDYSDAIDAAAGTGIGPVAYDDE